MKRRKRYTAAGLALALSLMLGGCGDGQGTGAHASLHESAAVPAQAPQHTLVAAGKPPLNGIPGVTLPDTEALLVRDPVGRDYPIRVALPADYAQHPEQRYPVLYVTDAWYSFPLVYRVQDMHWVITVTREIVKQRVDVFPAGDAC